MCAVENKNLTYLQLSQNQNAWQQTNGRTRILLVAINMPGYYSLPVRILSLLPLQFDHIKTKFDVRYIEIKNNEDTSGLVECVLSWQPEIVGFSMNIWNRNMCKKLADDIKKASPQTTIICGGQEVTNSVIDYLSMITSFDYIVDGEGEIPFRQFLEVWEPAKGLKDPTRVSGLRYREHGQTRFTGPGEIVTSLDHVPSPILAGLVPAHQQNLLGVMLEGSRGCPFRCSFCFEGGKNCKVRTASIERIAKEAKCMAARGARYYHILDPILCNSNIERLRKLSSVFDELRKQNPETVISVEAYAHHVTDEVAKYLQSFPIIDLGLQTTNPKTTRAIHRPYMLEKFRLGVAKLKNTTSTVNLYLICGLPYETAESFLDGVRFVLNEKPTRVFFNELLLLNGTELRIRAKEYGYQFNSDPPYQVHQSNWMSRREMSIVGLVSKLVEKHYNLSFRSFYVNAPWLSHNVPLSSKKKTLFLSSPCSLNCKNCSIEDSTSKIQWKESIQRLMTSNLTELDVICGANIPGDRIMRAVALLQLTGTNRLRIVSALQLFVNKELLEKLANLGFWHVKTFVRPCVGRDKTRNSLIDEDLFAGLQNLRHLFKLTGYASFRPFSEVVVYPENLTASEYLELICSVGKYQPSVITVPDSCRSNDEWISTLTEAFNIGLSSGYWVKMTKRIARQALGKVGEKNTVMEHLDALGFISHQGPQPPCHRTDQIDHNDLVQSIQDKL